MNARLQTNQMTGLVYLVVFITLMLHSAFASAQTSAFSEDLYKGFEVSFGVRNVPLTSDIAEINQSLVSLSGGQFGIVFGNKVVRSRAVLLGYYMSDRGIAGSIDRYESNFTSNLYPMTMLRGKSSRVEPYMTAGIAYDRMKFFGFYLNQEPGILNSSTINLPYIGKVKQLNARIGAGIEIKIIDNHNFVHLFSEVNYGRVLVAGADNYVMANTDNKHQLRTNVGVRFGMHR